MRNTKRDREEQWDRESWERWMQTVRANQKDPDEGFGSVGGTPYEGGVYSSGTYGSGAEFYSVTGAYENPLLQNPAEKNPEKSAKQERLSDERIQDDICRRLTQHPLIDTSLLSVHVDGGTATLSGEVLDDRMRSLAEDITDEVSGVKEIPNNIRIFGRDAA